MCNAKARWRIGIDVGGANTDGVILDDDDRLIAWTKTPTTVDVVSGIATALRDVLGAVDRTDGDVASVVLGTTQATNALVERRGLDRVGVVRIGKVSDAVPPLTSWPDELRHATVIAATTVAGGSLIDGHRVAPLDREAMKRFFDATPRR